MAEIAKRDLLGRDELESLVALALDEARALLAQLEAMETPPVEYMVRAYVELDRDRAFEWIHIAIDRHVTFLVGGLRTSIVYAELRKDPRWTEVMAHLEGEEAKGGAAGDVR